MQDLTDRHRLSAAVVLYHSGGEMLPCIQSFVDSDVYLDLYVVNNSPGDASFFSANWNCPGMHYLAAEKNLGYGAGNNLVLPKLRSTYHVICNPDVTFAPDTLRRMMTAMEESGATILTPRVLNPDGTEQLLPRRTPTVRRLISRRMPASSRYWQKIRQEYTLEGLDVNQRMNVEYATGCFMMVRTRVLAQQLHGFDPRFFLYHEDSDLSRRVLKKGGTILYTPDITITHTWKRDSAHNLKGILRHIHSTIQYFNKWGWTW